MEGNSTNFLVSIIIVTRNHLEHLEDCLKSVMNLGYPHFKIILADNNSTDGGPEFVQEKFPSVKVLRFDKNYGFAEGNNRAIKQARGDYIFLLNPDTKVEPECVNKLVEVMEEDKGIGICMPKMLMFNEPSVINSTGIIANEILQGRDRGAWELDCGQYDKEEQIIGACGAAMFIRRNLFEKIGYFDRFYFAYYEDLDFSIRTWSVGYKVVFVPEAIVYHKYRPFRKDILNEYIDHRNRLRMMLKNMRLPILLWMLPKSLYTDTKSIYRHLRGKRLKLAYYRLKALIWNLITLQDTLIKRVKVQMKRAAKDKPTVLILERLERIIQAPLPNYDVNSERSVDGSDLDSWVKMGENDIRHLGFGWYDLEKWSERNIRWTTNYGIIFLKNSLPRVAEETLQIEAFSSLGIEGTVWINGKRVGEFFIRPGEWQWFHFNFFSQAQVLKVTIKCNETFVPKFDFGEKDNRTLGIAISEIGIVS
ncbi:MAG: glycosyltransferase family 2 protein [Elusimicrobiota bacterium]|nr:glycosyltransferase family 2 protein [Elusimicrobiota bacterium]